MSTAAKRTAGPTTAPVVQAERMRRGWLAIGLVALAGAGLANLLIGPADISAGEALRELADRLPGISVDSGLSEIRKNIVWEVRAPRVALAMIVGAMLALAGGAYQGVLRNPLADPYLLGVASGAGLGATIAVVFDLDAGWGPLNGVTLCAFFGALLAMGLTWLVAMAGNGQSNAATLLLAGVAIGSFLAALQTYLQQRSIEDIREVYTWILGSLARSDWDEVWVVLPYLIICGGVILLHRRTLDVMQVGDTEAGTLGVNPNRVRAIVLVAATIGTAAAVAVSGLIMFVGLVVPHTVRLLAGTSNRNVLPLGAVFGAAFLTIVDLGARSLIDQVEVPISVLTAFLGAPFFLIILRKSRVPIT